ncbi:MAG TPA: hypothetical protein VGB91_05110 [Rhizomicrobium sp.]
MRFAVDAAAAVLFVLSIGLLFSEGVRASRMLFILVGIVALGSSYIITKQVLDATVGHRMHHRQTLAAPVQPAAAAAAPLSAASTSDALLESIYLTTESALNRIVRAGTKQSAASVSSDTVVDVIVGLSLAALGVLSQLFSALFRRLTGAAG